MTVVSLHVGNQEISATNPIPTELMMTPAPAGNRIRFTAGSHPGLSGNATVTIPAPGGSRRLVVTSIHGSITATVLLSSDLHLNLTAGTQRFSAGVILTANGSQQVSMGGMEMELPTNTGLILNWDTTGATINETVFITGFSEDV